MWLNIKDEILKILIISLIKNNAPSNPALSCKNILYFYRILRLAATLPPKNCTIAIPREHDIKLIWEKKSLSKCIIFNTKHLLPYTLLIIKKSYWRCKSNLNHCSRIDFSDPTTDKPGNLANSAVLRLLEEEEHGRRRPGKSNIL